VAEVAEGGPLGSTRLGFEVCPLTREAFTECYHPYRGEVCTARVVGLLAEGARDGWRRACCTSARSPNTPTHSARPRCVCACSFHSRDPCHAIARARGRARPPHFFSLAFRLACRFPPFPQVLVPLFELIRQGGWRARAGARRGQWWRCGAAPPRASGLPRKSRALAIICREMGEPRASLRGAPAGF